MKSNSLLSVWILICCALTSSCGSLQPESFLSQESFPGNQIAIIEIELRHGDIAIERSEDDLTRLAISGSGQEKAYQLSGDRLSIHLPQSRADDRITIQLAGEPNLTIQAFSGEISVHGIEGKIDIRSTAGDIDLVDFSGTEATLWAGRGNILVRGGSGLATLFGEHGELQVSSFDGPVSMTTIMGAIQYSGGEEISGDINLEADHGPIRASLPIHSDYQIEVNTASGEIVCSGGDLSYTLSGCQGVTGEGNTRFNIRTVSGRIELELTSNVDKK